MIPANQEDVCTVISVMPIKLSEDKPLRPSHYEIPACKDVDNGCESLMVKRGDFRVYIDENRPALIVPEPSDTIAQSICRDFKVCATHFQPGIAEPGLFWVRGGYMNQEILEAKELFPLLESARKLQTQWFKELIATADDDWARYSMRKMISDLQRIACKCLGISRAWDIDLEVSIAVKMTRCKFCQADVHPEAMICMHCRGILDMERYKRDYVAAQG